MDDPNCVPSLENFPKIPRAGRITVAESHAELHAVQSTPEQPVTGRVVYPDAVNYDVVSKAELAARLPFKIPLMKTFTNRAPIIVPNNQGIAKTVWDAWWEGGLNGVYNCLSKVNNANLGGVGFTAVKLLTGTSAFCLTLTELPSKLYGIFYPHVKWKTEDIHEKFSNIRRWKESWIRAIKWHPSAPLLAFALNDDSVRLCFVGHEDVPMLRCPEQANVSCLSWRPLITTEVAVGCDDCIVIWYLASTNSRRQTRDKTEILKVDGYGPISCLEYSADGQYLMSSSAKDSTVYLWQTFMWDKTPLRRISGGGIPLALYSPKGGRLLAASPNNVFWIWSLARLWECKRWSTPKTMIEAACWNPDGSTVLFATGGMIYGLYFELAPVDRFIAQTDSIVKPIFNIEECHVLDEDENLAYKVGGKVRHMEWDKSGQRVAVMFDDSDMIAVFRVAANSRVEPLVPLGFIRGHPDEYPLAISFQKNFKDGAILTIAWSSERIQYFPMIFALPSGERNMLHEENYRDQYVNQKHPSMFSAAGFNSPRRSMSNNNPVNSNVSALINEQNDYLSPNRLYSIPTDL